MTDFNPIEDLEILVQTEHNCIVRTFKLIPTLKFMQDAGWRIRELIPDDEYVDGIKVEVNVLSYYK